MNTLKNHTILYDAECPMCKVYTRAFTSTGMLDNNGRTPYQEVLNRETSQTANGPAAENQAEDQPTCPLIDRQRAVNEIALINKTTGEVTYGIDSLFKVIANAFPIFSPLFKNKTFRWTMRKLYAFISYNRKVIIPAPNTTTQTLQPTFNLRYRIAYLITTVIAAAFILTHYSKLLPFPGNSYREYLICAGQLPFQGLIISAYAPKKRWDYLGNMMTISFAGSLLLLPMLVLHPGPATATAWFLFTAALMLIEHIRRTKLLKLGWLPTTTWVLYRLALLAVIAWQA